MGLGSWITGAIGWALGGPLGGIIGYLLGSAFERNVSFDESNNFSTGSSRRQYSATEQRNSFLVSLLVLAAAVMKSDGKVLRSELEYVKGFIRANFGENSLNEALQILKTALNQTINIPEVCAQIKVYMNMSQRLQLFHFLIGIANADGDVCKKEIEDLKNIAIYLGIASNDYNSILAMFENDLESAYKVLEIESTATDLEVKKAYKKMAIKHHPDKVENLGPDVKKAAEEKFKAVVAAYEKIKKERGFN